MVPPVAVPPLPFVSDIPLRLPLGDGAIGVYEFNLLVDVVVDRLLDPPKP